MVCIICIFSVLIIADIVGMIIQGKKDEKMIAEINETTRMLEANETARSVTK